MMLTLFGGGTVKPTTFILIVVTFVTSAWAQGLEILTLRHRTAEQLLPQLQVLVEPGGGLTGSGDKLFLRASARNQAEIRQALEALDRPLRRLKITVRHEGRATGVEAGAGASVRLAPGDSRVRATIGERQTSSREQVAQQVQTIEGGRAFINVGQSIALPLRQVVQTPNGVVVTDTVVWQEIGTGFFAVPRLVGERVLLDISPRHDTPGAIPGSANVQHLSTTVSGRLGEWISLGGSARDAAGESSGILHQASRDRSSGREVWLRVEELR